MYADGISFYKKGINKEKDVYGVMCVCVCVCVCTAMRGSEELVVICMFFVSIYYVFIDSKNNKFSFCKKRKNVSKHHSPRPWRSE